MDLVYQILDVQASNPKKVQSSCCEEVKSDNTTAEKAEKHTYSRKTTNELEAPKEADKKPDDGGAADKSQDNKSQDNKSQREQNSR